jgi:hypothetical protein
VSERGPRRSYLRGPRSTSSAEKNERPGYPGRPINHRSTHGERADLLTVETALMAIFVVIVIVITPMMAFAIEAIDAGSLVI